MPNSAASRGLDSESPLTFDLLPLERNYLAKLLRTTRCCTTDARSLLAMLVGEPVANADSCWDQAVLKLAGEHRDALVRAGRAASLAAIGRGAYAALVEMRKERDGRAVGRHHREALTGVLEAHAERATALDGDLFIADLQPDLPPPVEEVLRRTLIWVRGGGCRYRIC